MLLPVRPLGYHRVPIAGRLIADMQDIVDKLHILAGRGRERGFNPRPREGGDMNR